MAGHSKWANIKHRKGAQDKKRANLFTKLAREIIVAAKSGQPDPEFNPRLRLAIATAKSYSMPKDRIENAIKKGSGEIDSENYDEIRYEGYGPGGIAIIIDALTDNRNRSASDVRALLNKGGGSLGESGSVNFMFDRIGVIQYPVDVASADDVFEVALEAGATDCESDDETHRVICEADNFSDVRDALVAHYGDPEVGRLDWKPQTTIALDQEAAEKILRLVDNLEDHDDVQYVSSNYEISDEILEALTE